MKKLIIISLMGLALTGCTHARHSQCQQLASAADGALIGEGMAGTYYAERQANIAQLQYQQCETTMDAVDYARGSSPQAASRPVQAAAATANDAVLNGLDGKEVAFISNGSLTVLTNNQSYSFIKAVDSNAPKDDSDTGVKAGDSVHAELFANNSKSLAAMFVVDKTQNRYWVSTVSINNGQIDKATGHDIEVKLK